MRTTQPSDVALLNSDGTDPTIVFPTGLVGCETWKRFVLLVDDEQDLPVAVLRCLDHPDVDLMVTDPSLALADYRVVLSAEDRNSIQLADGDAAQLYCTLTVNEDGWVTANLLGPLVINPRTRRGKQLVLADSVYTTRHPVARLDEANEQGPS
jgi:flagellar assembly factor FliW